MNEFKDRIRFLLRVLTQNLFAREVLLAMAQSNLLPKAIWRRLPVETTFFVSLPNGNSFKYSAIADDAIARAIFWRGWDGWEPETMRIFYKLAQKSKLFLDIGANTGLFTLVTLAANPQAKVMSFEPVPHVYKRLLSHIEMNGWLDRCDVKNLAVSNTVGETKLHIPFEDVPLSASLNPQGFRGYEGYLIDIDVTTIDTICSQNEPIDLIKIDAEGFDDKVLLGMYRILSNSAPTIIVECNYDGPFLAVETILSQFGYRFFHLRPEGPILMNKIVPDEKKLYRNFLCTVHEDWEELKSQQNVFSMS
jgi:FkbM family methyltransferase